MADGVFGDQYGSEVQVQRREKCVSRCVDQQRKGKAFSSVPHKLVNLHQLSLRSFHDHRLGGVGICSKKKGESTTAAGDAALPEYFLTPLFVVSLRRGTSVVYSGTG